MDYGLGIPGDGRCLFRSVVHGASIRTGKPSPSESLQRELADELRAKVADEFVKRRADTEWFLEDDFETYIGQMRQPHSWGGEPELLMASHVLHFILLSRMPITVYMRDRTDKNSSNLRIIAEYGQEYGKDNPIRVLYNGCGHYDALRSPTHGAQFKLFKQR
ncbi:OVARIAN TUMOR DOMAIN-containing deubiquitinating enzyme 4-like isoform X4 [Humulus lupulus]|uniref:OVARIAN TUMOR DOMAIN-containing deubiquitinating enzyme 4-like isoform X4 n=1 Tax=Humulus lupulus TaxID=3486 RepID=UPI002B4041F0|nr:OVARIAN TUMOR DOMAIN-containing deubiquitinating enzyme 4-like isoform X4 [Humulus lupulus]